jgi:hypothetical protein
MRNPFITIAVLVFATLIPLTACDPGSDSTTTSPSSANTTVDSGVGSKDATADVKIGTTFEVDSIGVPSVDVTITNNSDKKSDYYITVTLNTADGSEQLDDGVVFVDGLKPGQVKKDQIVFIGMVDEKLPKNAIVTLETVQRTAS